LDFGNILDFCMERDFEPTYPSAFMPEDSEIAPEPNQPSISGYFWKIAVVGIALILAVLWLRR